MTVYRIAEVSELVGVPASTLRFYEDEGVVGQPSRTANGYRSYDDRDVERLTFVARARWLDIGIDDLRDLVAAWETEDCSTVQHRMAEVVATRLDETGRQLTDLVEFSAQLQILADRLGDTPAAGPCNDDCPCVTQTPRDTGRAAAPPVKDDRAQSIPITCTLDSGAVATRLDDWRRISASAVSRSDIDGGVALRFPANPDVAADIARLAMEEQHCCAFFDFQLHLAGPVIEFQVRAPAEATDVVTSLLGAD